ncbi:MAG: L-threonylcarbamoyladenylate synthase [Halieaceae bacterium]
MSQRLYSALDALTAGGVVACPTEAVWGLSCDPDNPSAVQRLLALKQRPVAKGLILVASDIAHLDGLLAGLNDSQLARLQLSWPGPTTWLVPHHGRVPPWICGDHDSVAVRVTAHKCMRALCDAWGGALVSTSANPAGSQAPRERFQVQRYFGGQLDAILPGAVGLAARPSTIRDLLSDEIVRP